MKELSGIGQRVSGIEKKLKEKTAEFPSFAEDMNTDYLDLFKAEKPAKDSKIKQSVKVSSAQENSQAKRKEPIKSTTNEPVTIPAVRIKAVHKQAQNYKGETLGTLKTTDRLKEVLYLIRL